MGDTLGAFIPEQYLLHGTELDIPPVEPGAINQVPVEMRATPRQLSQLHFLGTFGSSGVGRIPRTQDYKVDDNTTVMDRVAKRAELLLPLAYEGLPPGRENEGMRNEDSERGSLAYVALQPAHLWDNVFDMRRVYREVTERESVVTMAIGEATLFITNAQRLEERLRVIAAEPEDAERRRLMAQHKEAEWAKNASTEVYRRPRLVA